MAVNKKVETKDEKKEEIIEVKKDDFIFNEDGESRKTSSKRQTKNKSEEVEIKEDDKIIEKDITSLDKNEIIKMMMKMNEEIGRLKEKITSNKEGVNEEEDYVSLLEDDYLDPPAVFFSFSSWFGLYSDKRRNKEVLPPNEKPIIFEKLYRYPRRRTEKGVEVVSVSQAVVRSKAEAEWLRNHSLFGIKFFENMNTAKNVNVTLAEKMVEQNAKVSSMNDYQVIERVKREGLPVSSSDISEIRKRLIQHLAEKAMKVEKEKYEINLKNAEYDENGRKIEYKKVNI